MDSLIKMDHLARSNDLDATTEPATPSQLGHGGRKQRETSKIQRTPTSGPPLPLRSGSFASAKTPSLLSAKVNRVEREHLFMRRLSSERQ